MTMTDDWGRLVVTGEALMNDWKLLYVPAPSSPGTQNSIKGDGWQLQLSQGENCTGRESRRLQNHE